MLTSSYQLSPKDNGHLEPFSIHPTTSKSSQKQSKHHEHVMPSKLLLP